MAGAHHGHEHDASGACVTHDASHEPRSVPNLRKALMQSQRVDNFGVMNVVDSAPLPTYSEVTPTIINIAVWYRPTYLSVLSEQNIHERINGWFAYVNQGMRDSGLNVNVRPLFIKNMDYDVRHLEHLVFDGFDDWFTDDTTHTYHYGVPLADSPRSQYYSLMRTGDLGLQFFSDEFETDFYKSSRDFGADLHLWVQEGNEFDALPGSPVGYGGILSDAMSMVDLATLEEDMSESRLARFNERSAQTLMHEIGHSLGLYHQVSDYDDGFIPRTGNAAFAFGECGTTGNTNTVMWATSGQLNAPRKPLYSNSELLVDGVICGDPAYSNQVAIVRENAPIVSTRGLEQTISGSVSFEQTQVTAYPGYENILFEVVRSGDLSTVAEVELGLIDGTAIEGEDFFGGAQQLQFREGQDRIVVSLDLERDEAAAPASFLAVLRYPLNVSIDGAIAVATINANSNADADYSISVPSSVALEKESNTSIVLTRTGNISDAAYALVKSADGTARYDLNYVAVDTFAYFAPGESTATFDIETLRVDSTRNFTVDVTSVDGATLSNSQINVDIMSGPPGAVHFNASGCGSATECVANVSVQTSREQSTVIPVELFRSGGDTGRIEVVVSYVDGAVSANTLNWEEQVVVFSNGQTSASFELEVPAGTSGAFTLRVSTNPDADGLGAANAPALLARYNLALPTQSVTPPVGGEQEVERKASSVNPAVALFMAIIAVFVTRRRAKVTNKIS